MAPSLVYHGLIRALLSLALIKIVSINHEYNTRSSSSKPESANDHSQVIEAVNGIKDSLNGRFDSLYNEFLNLKDAVIQRLQDNNKRLKEKIAVLEKRVERCRMSFSFS